MMRLLQHLEDAVVTVTLLASAGTAWVCHTDTEDSERFVKFRD